MTPRRIISGLLPVLLLYTRAFSIPFTPIPGAPYSSLFRFLHEKFPKLFTTMTDIVSNDIMSIHEPNLTNDKIFIPQHSYRNLENISIISNDFLRLKSEGGTIGKLETIDEIVNATTIRLNAEEKLQADMIISATVNADIELNVYRRAIPVGICNIAFIGFTGSVGYWMIAEVASHWISDYFLKRLKLPNLEEMYEEIKTNHTFIKKIFNQSEHDYRYYWPAPMEIYLNDIGLALHRTSNWISEYFEIYRPERLKVYLMNDK